jgi:hybrid cluster-associated redox disulfide protein
MEAKITSGMTIAEALKINPRAADVLLSKGMHCLGCVVAQGETIQQAAEVHGIDIEELIRELNFEEGKNGKG